MPVLGEFGHFINVTVGMKIPSNRHNDAFKHSPDCVKLDTEAKLGCFSKYVLERVGVEVTWGQIVGSHTHAHKVWWSIFPVIIRNSDAPQEEEVREVYVCGCVCVCM